MMNHGVHDFSREVSMSHSIKILDGLPIASLVLDAGGMIHDANPLAISLTGFTKEILLNKSLQELIAKDDQEDFTHWLRQLSSEQPPYCQLQMLRYDQFLLPLQLRAGRWPSVIDDVPLYLVTLLEAVPPKQASEQKADLVFQSAVLDSIGEAVIATDLSGNILYWNKAAELIYGWKSTEILGKNIMSITPVENNQDLGLEIMKALQSGDTWSGEFIVRHRDGHHFSAQVTDTCLLDQQGQLSVIIGVSTDLTEKKLLEQQRQRLETELYEQKLSLAAVEKKHLEEANRFKSDFIANMSHEIRTPLAVIRGYAEILAEGHDACSAGHIQSILRASRQVETLVNDILDISKIEAGKIEVELLPTAIAVILDDIKEMFNLAALEKNLALNMYIDPGVPQLIRTDPIRLKQILLNIIGNGIKFTHAGGISIKVNMLQRGAQNLLSFLISDTGIGMTAEQSAKIFSAYSQADRSITRKYGGTGLGLSLSLRLAQLLGGDLILEKSDPGQGSTFQLMINPGPVAEGAMIHKMKESTLLSAAKKQRTENALSDKKILIVEDAEDVRAIVRQVLERQCAQVTEAVNGEEAVHLVREMYFDAVMMDLQMPICDGFNATRRLRAEGYNVPIFALTAHAMAGERDRCMAAGFSGYLTKPINFKDMIAILSQEQKFAQDALRSNER